MDRIAVVGASLAGLSAAAALRDAGFDGQLVVLDAEPELPPDRPPLSKQVLAGSWDLQRASQPLAPRLDELDLELRLGTAANELRLVERRLGLAGGGELAFDGLVLATGATPRMLPGVAELPGLHVLRTAADCLALRADLEAGPARVVVVGAGFIGAEVAATCRGRGLEVTVVEPLAAPLARALGEQVGGAFAELHRANGVDLRLGVGVEAVEGGARLEAVRLTDGTRLAADVAVVGVGVVPATGWLEGSGLHLGDGVVCDETCLAAPGVVAAGDLARWPNPRFGELMRVEHWENAVEQGAHAGRRLLAGDGGEPYAPVPWFWSDQYDRKLQLVGRALPADEVRVVDGELGGERFVVLYRRGDRLAGVLGMNRPAAVMRMRAAIAEGTGWSDALARFA